MIKEQIEVIILAADRHSLLAGEEPEIGTEFQQEPLDVPQNCRLPIAFAEGIGEAEKDEKVRVAKDQIRRDLVGRAKLFEFLVDEVFGSPRDRSPLEEHASDPVAERAYTPPLKAAHLRVEAWLDRVVEIEDFFEMTPAHVLGQFRRFLSLGHASTNRIMWNKLGRLKPEPWLALNCLDSVETIRSP